MEKKKIQKCAQMFGWLLAALWMMSVCLLGRPLVVEAGTMVGALNVHQTDAGSNSFKVEWDKDVNAAGYEFQYSMDGSNWSSGIYTEDLYQWISNVNSGRSYYVRVRSYDKEYLIYGVGGWEKPAEDASYSAWSNPIEVVTMPQSVSEDRVKQTAGTSSTITVSWEAAEGATAYEVMYNMGESWFSAGRTTGTSYKITKLDADTRYAVSIRAIRKASTGYEKGEYNTFGHYCYTTAPKIKGCTLVKWDALKNRIHLKWDRASLNNSGYQIYITNFSGKKVKNFKTTDTETDFKLASVKNQGFLYKVRAYIDVDGTTIYGAWSNQKVVVAQPKVTLKKSGTKTINVSWQKIKGATSYTVYRSTSASTGFKKIKTVKGSKLTNKGLNPNKTYYYYVVANGVKVNKKTYKSTAAENREIAYVSYYGKTAYLYE